MTHIRKISKQQEMIRDTLEVLEGKIDERLLPQNSPNSSAIENTKYSLPVYGEKNPLISNLASYGSKQDKQMKNKLKNQDETLNISDLICQKTEGQIGREIGRHDCNTNLNIGDVEAVNLGAIATIGPVYWQFSELQKKNWPFQQKQFSKNCWSLSQVNFLNPIEGSKTKVSFQESNIKSLQKFIQGELIRLKMEIRIGQKPQVYFLGILLLTAMFVSSALLLSFIVWYFSIRISLQVERLVWIIYFAFVAVYFLFIIQFLRLKIKGYMQLEREIQKFSKSLKNGSNINCKLIGYPQKSSKIKENSDEKQLKEDCFIVIPVRLRLKNSKSSQRSMVKWMKILFSKNNEYVEVFLSQYCFWKVILNGKQGIQDLSNRKYEKTLRRTGHVEL